MARDSFDESKIIRKKKKKDEETSQKKVSSPSVNQNTKSYGDRMSQPVKRPAVTKPSTPQRQVTPVSRKTGAATRQEAQNNRSIVANRARQAGRSIINRAKESSTPENRAFAQRQKSGIVTAEDERKARKAAEERRRIAKNAGYAAKKGFQDAGSGYLQALDDLSEMTASNENMTHAKAMKMGLDPTKDKRQIAELERQRKETVVKSRKHRLALSEKQQQRQEEFDKRTKGAKGLEKALYSASESGAGMLTDIGIGAATGTGQVGALTSMGLRTYGSTRGQAQKEGATENEDRTYAALQALKEVGTELMFPGAGLAKGYAGKAGMSLAEKTANKLTRNLTGKAANATGTGLKLLGGTAEENAEEFAGWALDPMLKELSYGRNVRQREIQARLKEESDSIRANIRSDEDAAYAATYLGSPDFMQKTIAQCMDAGMSEKKATRAAEQMRDYLTASLSGDTESMEGIENELAKTISGKGLRDYVSDLDWGELKDTIASTSLLTLTTGLPGALATTAKGAKVRDDLGEEGIKALASAAADFEDAVASDRGAAARDRLNEGGDIANTQIMDLVQAQHEQVQKDMGRVEAKEQAADKQIKARGNISPVLYRDRQGNVQGDEVITKEFKKSEAEAKEIIERITAPEDSKSLTDTEIRNGAQAIAAFETGDFNIVDANELNFSNTEIRTAFEQKTGINLKQYVVRKKDGSVNIPATNAATKDALFAMAADNLVQTSELETQNWMDKVKGETVAQITQRMGGQGTLALQASLDNYDERDRSSYLRAAMAADTIYQAGRNMGADWEDVREDAVKAFRGVDEKLLRDMWTAGRMDKMMDESNTIGRSVKIGEKMSELGEQQDVSRGDLIIETADPDAVKGTVIRTFSEIAQSLGVEIHLVDDIVDSKGNVVKGANGTYKNGVIYLNVSTGMEKNVGYIFMHEVTHHLKQYAPEQYQELENLVRDKWFRFNPDQMADEINKTINLYKNVAGQNLTEDEALEEIIADACHEFINDPNFAKEVADANPSLAKSILNSIKSALRMLRQVLASGTINDETHMNSLFSQLGILDEAEKLWLNAYTEAARNQAAIGLVEWDEKANVASQATNSSDGDIIMTREEIRSSLSANFPGYDQDKTNLDIAVEAIGDLYDQQLSWVDFLEGEQDEEKSERQTAKQIPIGQLTWDDLDLSAEANQGDAGGQTSSMRRNKENNSGIKTVGRRLPIPEELIQKGYIDLRGHKVGKPEDLAKLCQVLRNPMFETSRIFYLKGDTIVGHRAVSSHLPMQSKGVYAKGAKYWSEESKYQKDVMSRLGADGYYIMHNHPSGHVAASSADKAMTKGFQEFVPGLKGHIILDHNKFGWITPGGRASERAIPGLNGEDTNFVPSIENEHLGIEWGGKPEDLAAIGRDILQSKDGYSVVVYMNSHLEINEIQEINNKVILNDKNFSNYVKNENTRAGAGRTVIYTTDPKVRKFSEGLVKTKHFEGVVYERDPGSVLFSAGKNISAWGTTIPQKRAYIDGGTKEGEDHTWYQEKATRFSVSEPVERVNDLIAVHNLKPEDIRNTFELGGFPMPSIAVTKDSMGHELYGDITLMFNSDTIDPEFFRSNQVFGGDAWTPTFPSIAKKVSRKVADKVDQRLRGILGLSQNDYTLGDLRLPALDDDNLTNALRYNEPYEAFKNDEVFQIAYLKNAKSFDVAVPTKEGKIRSLDKKALEFLDDRLPELTYNDIYDTVDHTMEYEPAVRQARKDYYESIGGVKLKALAKHLDEEMGYSDVIARLEALIKFREEGIPEVVDRDALKKILDENVDQEGYKAWIEDLFEGIIEKTGIRNDKDMFTASGNRRSWEALHDPVTLENVVKVMRAELAAGGTGIFGSNPKGAAQKQYKNLDEIRADEDRLQSLPEEEYKAQSEEAVGKMSEVCIAIAEHNPKRFSNSFGAALDVGSDIAEILNSTRKRSTIQSKLKKDYLLDVTDEQMDDLMEAIDAIANLPTGYFEAKPRRAVGFDEVKAAIIPQNIDEDIKAGLSERGISSYEYDPAVEGDRTAKVNEAADAQNLRFSITDSDGNNLSDGQATFFADSKMVDAEGKLKPMYHGTQNEFYEFDIAKAYPGTLGRGFYFSDSDSHAGVYGKTNKYYLNLVNPLMPGTNTITKDQLHRFVSELAEDEDYGLENYGYGATVDSVVDSIWGKTDFAMLRDLNLTAVGDFAEALKVFNRVNGTDYDGIITDTETLAFYPQQVKSVDNLNPTLSKDTRYSITDSNGKELTDGQVEYFKNSKARDIAGKLQRVFHTTNNGGFTVFDPLYSDDNRSLFFASNYAVSQTYGDDGANRPVDLSEADNRPFTFTYDFARYAAKNLTDYGWNPDKSFAENADLEKTPQGVTARVPNPNTGEWETVSGDNLHDLMQTISKLYGRKESNQTGYYTCYLNLENPLIVDAEGANWSAIAYGEGMEDIRKEASTIVTGITIEWDYSYDGVPEAVSVGVYGERKGDEGQWEDFELGDRIENPGYDTDDPEEIQTLLTDELYEFWENDYRLDYQFLNDIISTYVDTEGNVDASFDPRYFDEVGDELDASDYDTGIYSTRELAQIAATQGNDGVIIRNCRDIGGKSRLKGNNGLSDIFIAFSSEQIKDINNENPTENPDIRYSIVDDDEAMSHAAHDFAYDDSEEALAYYESVAEALPDSVLNSDGFINHPMQVFMDRMKKYGDADRKARNAKNKYKHRPVTFKNEEDFTSTFFAGLTRFADGMRFDDPVLEEGRTRMAKSRNEFFNSTTARWNQMWETEGKVLDIKSIEKAVRQLVEANMRESNTTRKYRADTVKKTLVNMRTAYWYAKAGRTDVADALLWHTALRMIEDVEFYKQDENYETYKNLRDYLRNARIQIGEEYWSDVDYAAFRKENFGKINLVRGETNIDSIFSDLYEEKEDGTIGGIAPEWFSPEAFEKNDYKFGNAPDILLQIAAVLDDMQPYAETYTSEYCAEWATDIADSLLDILQGEAQAVVSKADRYVNTIKEMKVRHEEAMRKVKESKENAVKRERTKFKEYKEGQKAKKSHAEYFSSIQKNYKKLTKRLLDNTADSNIPEQYKRSLAQLLSAFDMQTVASKKVEKRRGVPGQKTIRMAAMRTALKNIEAKSGMFRVHDAITDIIEELLGSDVGNGHNRSIEGLTIDELEIAELKKIDDLLKALVHEFNTYKTVRMKAKRQQVEDIGKAQVKSALDHVKLFGVGHDYYGIRGVVDRIINMDEMTPPYVFRRVDPEGTGIGMMYGELRRSFNHYARNLQQLQTWMDEILGEYKNKGLGQKKYGADQIEQWRSTNYQRTFNLENGTVTLTPAQMMSIYCLSKRTQAYNHMTGAGIVVAPVSFQAKIMSDLKKKADTALPVKLTDADIANIVKELTPDQVKVADKLQDLMATKMAAWGNEASMNVLDIELFGEPDYFPIRSDKAALTRDLSEGEFVEAIRSFGFTKAVQPGARNAIMVDDIFDVVAEHCNNMNLYNSYSESINDFMKVYNYRDFSEEGEYTVQQAIAHAYSQKATTYIMSFMKDLNGNVSRGKRTGLDDMLNESLSNAKKASVFANGRVFFQQFTAIGRAFAVINPKYLKDVSYIAAAKGLVPKVEKQAMDEMFEHCEIAWWKNQGYYDINMGKNIEDLIMNNGNFLEDLATEAYGAADNVTWTVIWQMVKAEMKDTHPDVKEGTEEYWNLCNERMSEIVDFTQVVDSPFHRSHAMRSKEFTTKLLTSFMAEPTLTFNMVRDGIVRAYEAWKTGNKAEANKIFWKTMGVFIFSASLTAAAAAIWDAVRGKDPDDGDDDDDKRFLHLWQINFFANLKDNLKLWNNIYYIKDIASLFDGWSINNLALQGWSSFAKGWNQLNKKLYEGSQTSWWKIYKNLFGGIGTLTGVPVKTLMNDSEAILKWFGVNLPDELTSESKSEPVAKEGTLAYKFLGIMNGNATVLDKLPGISLETKSKEESETEGETAEYSVDDLPDDLTDEQKEEIRKTGQKRLDKGVKTEEAANRDKKTMLYEAEKAAAGYEGAERDKKIWSSVSKGYKQHIEAGDFGYIAKMRSVVEQAGGDLTYFDEQVVKATKTAFKKTIEPGGADTESEMVAQQNMRLYLESHGVSQRELSAEIVYKSATAKDMKVAFRLNDEKAIVATTNALIWAGITAEDYQRIYDNRNRIDLKKYDGKYKDLLKSTGTFVWPTQGTITSHFGYRGYVTAGASTNHPAIDIGAATGTPVVASDGGVVISAGRNGGYGNSVGIKHDNGMITWYNHLYSWNVKVGDTVGQGQQIAQVGSTGISTGPHLDFKIIDQNGNPVDPEKYLH